MDGLTAVSLFAGIGGIDLALERSGVSIKAAVEIDEDCRAKLRQHFPESRLFNDVTEVTGGQLRAAGFVPERGILTGGFPCQDLSVAGRRKGLAGARSGLFWHVMRLADELRPRWLLLENVPGLLSAVCPCPGDETCVDNGRSVECGEWRAERVPGPADELLAGDDCFICGHPWDFHDAGGFCSPCQDTCEGLPEVKFREVFVANVPHNIKGGACPAGCMAAHGGAMGTVLGALGERGYGFAYRVLDAQFFGVPQRRRRVFIVGCLGDPCGPVEVLLEPEGGERDSPAGGETRTGLAPAARGGAVSALQGGGRRGHRIDAEGAAGGHLVPFPVALRGREDGSQIEAGDPAFTVRTPGGGSSHPMIAAPMAFNPQTGGSKARLGYGETPTALQANQITAVTIPVDMRNAARETEAGETAGTGIGTDGDPSFTLSATARAIPGVAAGMHVRRLTPLECERLQGFPDDWTDGQADSARYRQLGNSVAVPCVAWITRRIAAAEARLAVAEEVA